MIPTVVLVLTVLSSTLTLPIDDVGTGIGVPQIQGGISLPQQVQKTGVQGSFEVKPQAQTNQIEKATVHSGTSEQDTKVNNAQRFAQTEKTGAQVPSNAFVSPQNSAVPKVENVPVNVEPAQTSYSENPVLLPIQPLSVVSANQAGQVLQPVVVPVETIPAGRMAIDSFQQRNFQQDVINVPQSQLSYQQVVQPVTYAQVPTQNVEPNQQTNYVTLVEKPNQAYSSVQVQSNLNPLVKEQTAPVIQTVHQTVVPTSNYSQTPVEPNVQVYSVQHNEQPVITEDVKKQASASYGAVQTQFVKPSVQQQQQYNVQQSVEKQVPYQQSGIQSQTNFAKPSGFENVKQVPSQQYSDIQTQNVEQNFQQQQVTSSNTQQVVKQQVPYQQVDAYTPVQNQPVGQSVYSVQSVVVEKPEKVGQYQEGYSPVQTQSVGQTQSAQHVVEKQVPYQQPTQVQTYPVEPVNQQQVFSVQPFTAAQVENQVQYQKGSQFQNVGYFPEKAPENSEFEPNQQVFNLQPQEVAHYAGEYNYSFGDKISQVQQNAPVHTLTSVPQNQDYSVQPSVGSA